MANLSDLLATPFKPDAIPYQATPPANPQDGDMWCDSDASHILPATINTNNTSYTITVDDNGKILTFTGVATLTLPAASGFPEGFQAIVWNMCSSAVDVTLSGTFNSLGTKVPQYLSCMLLVKGSTWYAAGGLS